VDEIGTSTFDTIDNLSISYAGNQLIKADDAGINVTLSASMDFKNNSTATKEYFYDLNGNLAQDLNKGITGITYNLLNFPQSVVISNTLGQATNTYTYAADGRKLRTVQQWSSTNSKQTDYVGNVIYENGLLKRILVDGGYIEGGAYYFYLTDNLGNNRVVVNANGGIVQTNHYYPFGMSFAEGVTTSGQPYKYNGKELDTERGLNLYDYSARLMDPVLGRFSTMDPLAEKCYGISPYVYCLNNPIRLIDPDGREVNLDAMSEEERKMYELNIAYQRKNSRLFDAMYLLLENSKEKYVIKYGKTTKEEGSKDPVEGQFVANKNGGGTVIFSDLVANIKLGTLTEELFHAFQHDNKANYANGEFNREFEAKIAVAAIGSESGGYGSSPGAQNFQDKIAFGNYGNDKMIVTPDNVVSKKFINDYKKAANSYSMYNRKNNIGNINYRKDTMIAPYSFQEMIKKAYGK